MDFFRSLLAQLVKQCLRILKIRRAEALGEPAVNWHEKVTGFGAVALIAAEPGEADGGAQFPELGLLFLSDCQGLEIELLSGLGMPLPLQQLAFVPVQLGHKPAFPYPFRDL